MGNLAAIGNIIGGVGSAFGAYQQSKMAKELLKMQKLDRVDEKKRKKTAQARLNLAAGGAFGQNSNTASLPTY